MATITQYRPAFFSGFENQKVNFGSLEELFSIEFVDNFKRLPNGELDTSFLQYSKSKLSDEKGAEYALMAEYRRSQKKFWYVIGYLDDNQIIKQLPDFRQV